VRRKFQDERTQAEREAAFLNEVEYLGLSRESLSFAGVDGRHNSSSSASSPYTFSMARPSQVPSVLAMNTAMNARSSLSQAPNTDTRNPMRGTEVEMRATGGKKRLKSEVHALSFFPILTAVSCCCCARGFGR
jgi:hypothetical protein